MSNLMVYPLDLEGTNPECLVKDEVFSLSSSDTAYRAVVPLAAPFYTKDFKVVFAASGKELVEGTDYYFSHKLIEIEQVAAEPLYSSVTFINPSILGEIAFEYRTIGGQYVLPRKEVLRYLVNHLNDPKNVRWLNINDRPVQYPMHDHRYHREDHVNLDGIVAELDDLTRAINDLAEREGDDSFGDLDTKLNELKNIVNNSGQLAHIQNFSNSHNVTPAQAGALDKDASAVDTFKAFNKTLLEIADHIYKQGLVREELLKYLPLFADHEITGDIILEDGVRWRNSDRSVTVNLDSGHMHIVAENGARFRADSDNTSTAEFSRMSAGKNILQVMSSQSQQDEDGLTYNGEKVLHTGNMQKHLPGMDPADMAVRTKDTETVRMEGTGREGDPLKLFAQFPLATTSKKGVSKYLTISGSTREDVAISQKSIAALATIIRNLVPDSRTVNGERLNQDITLTKDHIDLDQVDNTRDMDKPLSDPQKAFLDTIADGDHTHDFGSVFDDDAGEVQVGIAKLVTDKTSSLTEGAVITPSVAKELDSDLVDVRNMLTGKLPDDVIDVTQYGGMSYLPVPVYGSYEGSGIGNSSATVGLCEADGKFVFLRNGKDLSTEGVFYTYCELNADGTIHKYVPTTTRYEPSFLPEGVTLRYVERGTEDAFIGIDYSGKRWLIVTNGTMDGRRHQGVIIDNFHLTGHQCISIREGDRVYWVYQRAETQGMEVELWYVDIAEFDGDSASIKNIPLSGKDIAGTQHNNMQRFTMATGVMDQGSARASDIAIKNDNGKWTSSFNIRHSSQNTEIAISDGVMRILFYCGMYFSNASTSMWGGYWNAHVDIDLATGTISMEDDIAAEFPLVVNESNVTGDRKVSGEGQSFPGANPNNTSGTLFSRGRLFSWRFYGTLNPPTIYAARINHVPEGPTQRFDSLDCRGRSIANLGGKTFTGNFGSVSGNTFKAITFCAPNLLLSRQTGDDGSWLLAEFDPDGNYEGLEGFGPTSNRQIIDEATYRELKLIPYCYDGQNNISEGGVFWRERLTCKTKSVNGVVNGEETTLSQAAYDKILAYCQSMTQGATTHEGLSIHIHRLDGYPCFAEFHYSMYRDDTGGYYINQMVVTFDVDSYTGTINDVSNFKTHLDVRRSSTGRSVDSQPTGGWIDSGGDSFAVLPDGTLFFHLGINCRSSYVGSSSVYVSYGIFDPTTETMQGITHTSIASYNPNYWTYRPDSGIIQTYKDPSNTGILSNWRGHGPGWDVAQSSQVIHSSQVESGWIVYFTESVNFYINRRSYELEEQSFDLRELYPNSYQNSTFYIYVAILPTGVSYVFQTERTADDTQSLYIGYCITDSQRIVELNVERATRLGSFRELVDHINDPNAHGLGDLNAADVGLDLIENKGVRHELVTPRFSEVFNDWYRFSHHPTGDYPDELEGWEYNSGADSVRTTINSSSFIGIVSNEQVGDYVFDTYVSSTDGDDDWCGVVLAFIRDVGTGDEFTLSLNRVLTGGTNPKRDHSWILSYNNLGPGNKVLARGGNPINTGYNVAGKSRLRITRTGREWFIEIFGFTNSAEDKEYESLTLKIDDHPELEVFNGSVSFGYCSQSQRYSTYENIIRPDEDGRAYYASAQMVNELVASIEAAETALLSGDVVHGATIPIPSGYLRSQCHFMTASQAIGPVPKYLDGYDYAVTSAGVATARYKNETTNEWSAGALRYIVVGKK